MVRSRRSAGQALLMLVLALVIGLPLPSTGQTSNSIAVDAGNYRGFVQPSTVGQMMEWTLPHMNQAWAEKVSDRSLEGESVLGQRSPLYDAFAGAGLDRSRWTPLSLDTAPAGSVSVANSQVTLTAAQNGRFGIMGNNIQGSRYASVTVETRITSYTGTNAILSLYAGSGAGDFSNYVEFAIEGGVLKVYADGITAWTDSTAATPATPLSGTARDLRFYYNGALVHTLNGFTKLVDPFRVFLYGWSGSVTYEYLTIDRDDTYDNFAGATLSPRWTRLA